MVGHPGRQGRWCGCGAIGRSPPTPVSAVRLRGLRGAVGHIHIPYQVWKLHASHFSSHAGAFPHSMPAHDLPPAHAAAAAGGGACADRLPTRFCRRRAHGWEVGHSGPLRGARRAFQALPGCGSARTCPQGRCLENGSARETSPARATAGAVRTAGVCGAAAAACLASGVIGPGVGVDVVATNAKAVPGRVAPPLERITPPATTGSPEAMGVEVPTNAKQSTSSQRAKAREIRAAQRATRATQTSSHPLPHTQAEQVQQEFSLEQAGTSIRPPASSRTSRATSVHYGTSAHSPATRSQPRSEFGL